jgi:sec-independent protein translocase protein TatC
MMNKRRNEGSKEMPFLEHLEELRQRLLKSIAALVLFSCAAFAATDWMLDFLTYPNSHLARPAKLIFLKPTSMLMLRMEIALAAGLIASLPVIIYQLWQFIAPGLLPKERKYVTPVILLTVFCFFVGGSFAYFVMIPVVLPFLFSLGTKAIEANININDYMSFVLRLILATGLVFELPMVAFFLARLGLITPVFLRKFRRYGYVLIFVVAAIITPTPDPVNQTILAIPLMLLYEISIWVTVIAYKKREDAGMKTPEKPSPVRKKTAKKPVSKKKPKLKSR